MQLTWFDIMILIIIVIALIRGYMTGIITQLATLAGIILGAKFGGSISHIFAPYVIKWTDASSPVIELISCIIGFLIIFFTLVIIGKVITKILKPVHLGIFNRIAGGFFCAIKWVFIMSVLLNIIIGTGKQEIFIKENTKKNSFTYNMIKSTAPMIIPYLNFDWIKNYN